MRLPAVVARVGWRGRVIAAAGALALVGACAVVVTTGVGSAESVPLAGVAVPATVVPILTEAAGSCPALTPARLAGQVMQLSRFVADATTSGGGRGIAGFTDALWKTWAPWSGADRTDPRAAIPALAHEMCDLVGQVRAAGIPGDPWQLSLAAYHSGADAVRQTGSVPADATAFVDTVNGYAAWYAAQAEFGGGVALAPTSTDPVPVPDAYLPSVLTAGRICAPVSPARIAAQLMALSGFNAHRLGDTGAQGIAQFPPALWPVYAGSGSASPWDPSAAIPALGRAMCDLTRQLAGVPGDPYGLALAAYGWGADTVRKAGGAPADATIQAFAHQVQLYADFYARDPRLATSAPPGSTGGPATTATPGPTTAHPSTTKSPGKAQPPPPPPPPPPPVFTGLGFVNSVSGLCLSALRAADGTHSQVAACDGAQPEQWAISAVDSTIHAVGLCMDAANAATDDGTPVQVATCSGNPAQHFTIQANGTILSTYANKCVDVSGISVILFHCTGSASQHWIRK